jgi:putative tryptophan/tyrosine transport system substrate-binding protein
MRRRDFITLLGGAAAAWPLAARAQQADGAARIGVLSPLSASETTSAPFEAFRKALRDLGYIEGKGINFIYRWADGNRERLAEFATDLASSKVDVIFSAPGTPTAIAARNATTVIPIVFAGAGDVVATGLARSHYPLGASRMGCDSASFRIGLVFVGRFLMLADDDP